MGGGGDVGNRAAVPAFAGKEAIAPEALRGLIQARRELAVIDVREEIPFSKAHLFLSACVPLSRLEPMSARTLPCLNTPICCVDDDEGLAERAVKRLKELGYRQVARLAGGIGAWHDAGYPLYSGVHVPSKAFAEVVEHRYDTGSIDAEELDALIRGDTPVVVLDGRSYEEYKSNSIPSAYSMPNGELVLRIHDLVPDPDTLVVVNCGGRTRSIIGAQTLVDLGVIGKAVALRNGTMAWHLANLPILTDQDRPLPRLTEAARERARDTGQALANRFGVDMIDQDTLAQWQSEAAERTLYLLDVRTPPEFEQGHLPGAISAPGGQLLQETEVFAPVFRARVVLVDDGASGRAAVIAAWLVRLGWSEVAVLAPGRDAIYEIGPSPAAARGLASLDEAEDDILDPREADARVRAGDAVIVDVGSSKSHRAAHIPGAYFAIRSRLEEKLSLLPAGKAVILTCEDGIVARFAAADLRQNGHAVTAIGGGNAGWRSQGLPVETGLSNAIDDPDDVWYAPRHREGDREAAMREYLSWEVALADQVRDDPDVPFNL
jgi:rhodanese-related sulfurtransferase